VRDSIPRALCRIGEAAAARVIVIGNQPTGGFFSPLKRLRHWAPCEVQVVDTDDFRGGRRDPLALAEDEALSAFPRSVLAV
ncbi:MAG TPA: hypothetical protein VD931_21705, partial [Baekduia sp.]|nr:hypothetical protein [Baekduia sp.]